MMPIIDFEDSSADGNKLLIFAGSDSDPGRYYLFDKPRSSSTKSMLVRPELENRQLAEVKAVSVHGTGRDLHSRLI